MELDAVHASRGALADNRRARGHGGARRYGLGPHPQSHRDAEITDLDLAFDGLPPYRLEPNPAEHLFGEIRRRFEGRAYAILDNRAANVQVFLEEPDANAPRTCRLCGWNWINANIASLSEPLEIAVSLRG